MAGTNKVAIEVTLDSTGAVTGIKNIDAASQAWLRSIDAEIEALERAGGKATDLTQITGRLGKETLGLAGHTINVSLAMDSFRDAEASAGQKMAAMLGGMASLSGATDNLGRVTGDLKKTWDAAGGSMGNLLKGDVGVGAAATAFAVLGTQIVSLVGHWQELSEMGASAGDIFKEMIGIQTDLAGISGKSADMTDHQNKQLDALAKQLGITTEEMTKQGITLENVNRLAKDGKHPELTAALKGYRVEVVEAAKAERDRAGAVQAWRDEQDKARKAIDDSSNALIKQKGVLSDGEIATAQAAIAAGYEKIKGSSMGAAGAARMFAGDMVALTTKILEQAGVSQIKISSTNGELSKLVALAKEGGVEISRAFAEAGRSAAESEKWTRLAKVVHEEYLTHLEWEKAKHIANKNAVQEKTEIELTNIKRVTDAMNRAEDERAAYKAFKITSDLSGSGDERVQVDKNDPAIAAILSKLKKGTDYSGYSSGAASAIASGDVAALKNLQAAIQRDIGRDLGTNPMDGAGGTSIATMNRAGDLSGVGRMISEALARMAQSPAQPAAERAQVDMVEEARKQTVILTTISAGMQRTATEQAQANAKWQADVKAWNSQDRSVVITPEAVDAIVEAGIRRRARNQPTIGRH